MLTTANTPSHLPARLRRFLLLSVPVLLLAGCGGGEDSAFDPLSYLSQFAPPAAVNIGILTQGAVLPANVATLTQNLLNSTRYQNVRTNGWTAFLDSGEVLNGLNSDPLRSSGAAFAHAAGFTGKGETVAVSDGSYISGYAEFSGTSVNVVNNGTGSLQTDPHGTVVSSVIAGDSTDSVGVAPDANLIFGTYQSDQTLTAVGIAAANAGAVAWNNSWGYFELNLNEADLGTAFSGSSGAAYYSALQTYAANGVVVFAVSNTDTLRHSQLLDGLPALRPSFEAGWIAAVNGVPTFSGGNVSSVELISSACWEAARWCLIADGTWQVPDYSLRFDLGTTETKATGSSFAAPQISGALAVLAEAFPSLTPHQLRVRLLASADDSFFTPDATVELATGFEKGYSVIYGHGFLDIEAALKPIGPTAMALSDGTTIDVGAPVLQAGTAMGDSVERALAGTTVAVQDALATGFAMPGEALVGASAPTAQADVLMATARRAGSAGSEVRPLAEPFAAYRGQTLALNAPDDSTRAAVLLPEAGEGTAGLMLSRALIDEGSTRVDLGLTIARDGGGTLALAGAGGDAAMAASVSLGLMQEIGAAGFISLAAEVGVADLGRGGAVAQAGSATFNRIGFEAGQSDVFRDGDRISVGVGLPLAITSGDAQVTVPVATPAGIGMESIAFDLSPEARQMDLTFSYLTPLTDQMDMTFLVAHSENFGNRSGATDTGAALLFSMRF
jgi:subtilase-type serine protease